MPPAATWATDLLLCLAHMISLLLFDNAAIDPASIGITALGSADGSLSLAHHIDTAVSVTELVWPLLLLFQRVDWLIQHRVLVYELLW